MRTSSRPAARPAARSAAVLLAGGLAASLALSAAPASASDPGESTITAPTSGSSESAWTGSVAQPGFEVGGDGTTDEHVLVVKAPGKGKKAKTFFTKNTATLDIVLSWAGPYNDLDLNVYDANGTEVATSGNAPLVADGEAVSIPVSAPGTYTVEVVSYLAEPGVTYDAVATLSVG